MEVTAVEEKCDRRIELLTQSIKKARKRARIERIEEDDEEWVPSVFLHAEQTKVRVSELGRIFQSKTKIAYKTVPHLLWINLSAKRNFSSMKQDENHSWTYATVLS